MEQQFPDTDGFQVGNPDGIVKEILDPGTDFAEQLARAGLPFEDAMDYADLWRTGVTFRIPELIAHAVHAIVASIGADRLSRGEAIEALIGHRQRMAQVDPKKRSRFLNFGNRGKSDSPEETDRQQ